ncbi:MAG: hypothetical protein ACOCZL_02410 [Bacteroidota bacterium]
MKRSLFVSLLLLSFIVLPNNSNAQCKQFAKNTCKVGLTPYQHDGNYHAAVLLEGEEAELYKTFYSGTDYRIGVCGANNLGNIEFSIIDGNGKVLHNNAYNDYEWKWDFRLESSQQLKIVVKVPVTDGLAEEPKEGCVAIMFGFKEE